MLIKFHSFCILASPDFLHVFHLCHLLCSLLFQKMSQEFEIKRLSLEEQRDRLQQQLDNLKEELTAKVNMANQEVGTFHFLHISHFLNCLTFFQWCNICLMVCLRCPTSRRWWEKGSRTWIQLRHRYPVWRKLRTNSALSWTQPEPESERPATFSLTSRWGLT